MNAIKSPIDHKRQNRVGRVDHGPHRFLTVWAAHAFGPHGIFQLVQRLESRVQPIYSVSQKSNPLKLFAIFSLMVNLCN